VPPQVAQGAPLCALCSTPIEVEHNLDTQLPIDCLLTANAWGTMPTNTCPSKRTLTCRNRRGIRWAPATQIMAT